MLQAAHYGGGISLQSNLARTHCYAVAMAASLGLITTRRGPEFGRRWHTTAAGLVRLEDLQQ